MMGHVTAYGHRRSRHLGSPRCLATWPHARGSSKDRALALASWKRGVSDGDVAPNPSFFGCVPELASPV